MFGLQEVLECLKKLFKTIDTNIHTKPKKLPNDFQRCYDYSINNSDYITEKFHTNNFDIIIYYSQLKKTIMPSLKTLKKEYYTTEDEFLSSLMEQRTRRIGGLMNILRYLNDKYQIKKTRQWLDFKLKSLNIQKSGKYNLYFLTEEEIEKIFTNKISP